MAPDPVPAAPGWRLRPWRAAAMPVAQPLVALAVFFAGMASGNLIVANVCALFAQSFGCANRAQTFALMPGALTGRPAASWGGLFAAVGLAVARSAAAYVAWGWCVDHYVRAWR